MEPDDPSAREFSINWTILSVVLFLAFELLIGTWLGPLVAGKYVSPMFHTELKMGMHLLAIYLGGMAVGFVSPGRRLAEPAVGAVISVVLVFLMSVFMPHSFWAFDWTKVFVGGTIAMLTALAGAWHAEKLMGNLDPNLEADRVSARGRLRARLWADDDGLLRRRDHTRLRD